MKKNILQKAKISKQQQHGSEFFTLSICLKGINKSYYFIKIDKNGNIANESSFKQANSQIQQDQTIKELKIDGQEDKSFQKVEKCSIYETILESLQFNSNVKKLTLQNVSKDIIFQKFQQVNFLEELSIIEEQKPLQIKNLILIEFKQNQRDQEQTSYFYEIPLIKFQNCLKAFYYNLSLQSKDLVQLSQCNLQYLQTLVIKIQIASSQDIQVLNQAFKAFQNLQTLNLSLTSIINQEINQHFICWKNIEQLQLLSISLPSILIFNFLFDLNNLTKLKQFSLAVFNRIDEKQAEVFGQQIEKMQKISMISLSLNDCQLTEQITKNMFDGFQNQKNAQLIINNENLNEKIIQNIFSTKFKNLQTLRINFKQQYLSLQSIKILKDNLITFESLNTLQIQCDKSNINLFYLLLLKMSNPNISIELNNLEFQVDLSNFYLKLDFGSIRESEFDQEGSYLLQQLFSQFDNKIKHLQLIFGYLDITNKGIQIITKNLMLFKNLTHLHLNFFWNFKISYVQLAESFLHLKNLNYLEITPQILCNTMQSLYQIKQLHTLKVFQEYKQYNGKAFPQMPNNIKIESVIQNIFKGLSNFINIKSLYLSLDSSEIVTENNLKMLLSSLIQMKNLKIVSFFFECKTSKIFLLKQLQELLNKRTLQGLNLNICFDYQNTLQKKSNEYMLFIQSLIQNRQLTFLKLNNIIDSTDFKNKLQIQCIKKLQNLVVFDSNIFNIYYANQNGGA
ncbi:hypothetical protein ABPG74_016196 [Tetrahymena malaccensis]